jgi:cysteine-rich repeat protein
MASNAAGALQHRLIPAFKFAETDSFLEIDRQRPTVTIGTTNQGMGVAKLAKPRQATHALAVTALGLTFATRYAVTDSTLVGTNATMGTLMVEMGNLILLKLASCSPDCFVEEGYYCENTETADICDQICGDGITFLPAPSPNYCDDGNLEDSDGCNS